MGSPAYRARSKTSLPSLYGPLARPTGIVGAIVVESSSWVEDNLWYLEVAQTDPIIVGISGRLTPTNRNLASIWSAITKTRFIGLFAPAASTALRGAKSHWTR